LQEKKRMAEPREPSCVLHVHVWGSEEGPLEPFRDLFEKHGSDVMEVNAPLVHDDGEHFGLPRGDAEIVFYSPEDAKRAYDTIAGRCEDHDTLRARLGTPLPVTKRLRANLQEEPSEDFYYVVHSNRDVYIVHDTEYPGPGKLREFLLAAGPRNPRWHVGDFDARLRECLATMGWKGVEFIE